MAERRVAAADSRSAAEGLSTAAVWTGAAAGAAASAGARIASAAGAGAAGAGAEAGAASGLRTRACMDRGIQGLHVFRVFHVFRILGGGSYFGVHSNLHSLLAV